MEKKRLLILVVLLATLVALLPGCGKKGDDTYRLGLQLPLTGEMAYTGQGMKKAYDVVIEDINKKGGFLGKQIEIFYEDDKGDPKEAALVADRIKAKKPHAVIGPYSSVSVEAAQPIYQEAGILQIAPSASSNRLTLRGYNTYFIRTCWNDDAQAIYFADYVKKFWPTKNLWVLHDGTAFPKGWTDGFVKFAQERGLSVNVEQFNPQDRDFSPTLTMLKGKGAEVVVFMGYYAQMGLMAKQAYDLGATWQWVLCDEFNQEVVKISGPEALQGVLILTSPLPTDLPYPESKAFNELWKAKYGEYPEYLVWPLAADGVYVLKAGIEGANSFDGKAIADWIKKNIKNYNGVYGPIQGWTETGESIRSGFMMYTVDKDGAQVLAPASQQLN
jgi:branched-chain amino acid transport system substrate-binding protein